jgi:hypothetical protein
MHIALFLLSTSVAESLRLRHDDFELTHFRSCVCKRSIQHLIRLISVERALLMVAVRVEVAARILHFTEAG